jgi:hypothetical protein
VCWGKGIDVSLSGQKWCLALAIVSYTHRRLVAIVEQHQQNSVCLLFIDKFRKKMMEKKLHKIHAANIKL